MDAIIDHNNKVGLTKIAHTVVKNLFNDARHYQIVFLFSFYCYGVAFLSWSEHLHFAFFAVVTCLLTQLIFCVWNNGSLSSLKSALISGFSIALMLKAGSIWPVILASVLSIGSKFIIQYKGKHIYNPTNFGIMASILLTGNAWVSPGQWGSQAFFIFIIGISGLLVLLKAKRLDTGLLFLFIYSFLLYVRLVIVQGWEFEIFLHQLSSGTLLLFAFFMITDPVTTPRSFKGRFIWTMLIAIAAFAATSFYYINGAPLWSLFVLTPLSIVLNKIYPGQTFKWK
ncbi:MAG TPA: RnfABCDGE type electron transport complex subunit D [Bacteroidia bacterium]|nr:RnfABCDGE type electron transport complex subunit D [Bacteroidia bacterium]HNT79369.1 RnfABCDGE type electron transport complex subunit D [Bacteroidia bacterium]